MSASIPPRDVSPRGDDSRASFLTTRWSVVRSARSTDAEPARAALGELLQGAWLPLYAFLRRRGLDAERAADSVQGFCARLLEKRDLGELAPEHGRFRAFLLAALQHHLAHEREKERAQKRGGDRAHVALDADSRLQLAAERELTPEQAYEREWALALLARVLESLRAEYAEQGKGELFELLKPALQCEHLADVEHIAAQLGTTAGAVKVAGTRLRQRYRERLRAAIADTVGSADEVDGEIRELFAVLARR